MVGPFRVTLILLITAVIVGQTEGCPAQCRSCDNDRVICSQASLTNFPKSLPQESLSIDFSQNAIKNLKGMPSLPNTMSMTLAGNELSLIPGKSFGKAPELMRLDLSMNKIRKVYKQGFNGLDKIMTISLNGNLLTSIGKAFINTPALSSLRLSFNKITEIEKDSFENNKMLKMLDFSNNAISKIHPKAFEKLNMLRILILSNNPLGTLPEMTFSSTMLSLADFTNCELTAVPRKMPESLNDFRLGNNKITKIFADDFKNITKLNLLTLNDNQISDVEHRSFYYNENLMELWMSRNSLVYIPRGLPMHLEKFHIDNNQIVEFEPMLFKQGSMLKVMSLEANSIQRIHRLALKELQHLETLNLQGNQINVIEAGTFENLRHLKTITLANNPVQRIQNGAFVNLNNLTDISLAYIEGQSTPGQPILTENPLVNMPNLQTLDLMSSVYLAKELIEQFDHNKKTQEKMQKINLQYNDLTSLPETVKEVFKNADHVLLDGNIFVCDKRLVWLNKWMKTSEVQFYEYEQPVCHQSGELDGRPISELLEREFTEVSQQNKQSNQPNEGNRQAVPEVQDPIQEAQQSKPQNNAQPHQPQVLRTLSGSRASKEKQQAASKYDNPGASKSQQVGGYNIYPQRNNNSPAKSPANPRPVFGTRVVIKPPRNGKQKPARKNGRPKLTKKEREARKAARKALRLRQRNARKKTKRTRRHHDDQLPGVRKRRHKKRCKKDENGATKCSRRRRKRCKVQDDGSVKCRKRKGKKKNKDRTKEHTAVSQNK